MEVVYEVSATGIAETQAALEKTTQTAARTADETSRMGGTLASKLDSVGFAIKNVGKDLDNIGLASGKSFAMATEGALSIVAALGTGGVAGVVGLVTVGVGYLAQAWADEKAAAQEAAKAADQAAKDHKKLVDEIAAGFAKQRAALDMASLIQQEDQINARRVLNMQRSMELVNAHMRVATAIGTTDRLAAIKERDRLEGEITAENAAIRADAAEVGRKKNIVAGRMAVKEIVALQAEESEGAKKAAEDKKKAEEELEKKREAHARAAADRAAWENEMAGKYPKEKYDAERKAIEASEDATKKATEAEKKRREELAKTTAELEKKRGAEMQAIAATQLNATVNLAFAATSMVVRPFIGELTATMREMGTVNRENYQEFSLFSDELPAIIAKKTQAILGGIAAEATASALQSTADAARESALGLGLLFIQPQAAAAHFASSGVHLAAASAYGAISGVSLAGAVGIGAMRGGGGPIPLTREEQERQGRDRSGGRDVGGGSSLTGRGSDGGSMSGAEPFVVNISYQAGSMTATDERRTARTVAHGVSRARRNAFTRRSMEG